MAFQFACLKMDYRATIKAYWRIHSKFVTSGCLTRLKMSFVLVKFLFILVKVTF